MNRIIVRKTASDLISHAAALFVLILGGLLILFPLYLTLATALKTPAASTAGFFLPPVPPFWGNVAKILATKRFGTYVANSLLITALSVGIIAFFTPMVAYAVSRNPHRRLYRFLHAYLTAGIFVPFQVVMIPLIRMLTKAGGMNQWGLMVCYATYALIQGVFLYAGYLKSIPFDMDEAAIMDGCGVLRTFFLIIFPMAAPMTATLVIINALWIWNDFQLPLLVLNRSSRYWTLPLFQYNFKSQYTFDFNLAFASFLFSIIPIMVLYLALQKHIIRGLTAGAVKG